MLIPLRVDVPTDRYPIVNIALMLVIISVSVAGFYNHELIETLGGARVKMTYEDGYARPVAELDTSKLPLPVIAVTCTLVHGGILHLVGNMLFMYIFGYGVNYKFGQGGFALLYVFSGFCASMAHYALNGAPVIGASGAIYGLMGAFLIYFCQNNITMFFFIFPVIVRVFTVASGWIILLWVVWDGLMLWLGFQGNTAIWAHLGGFAAGVLAASAALRLGWVRPTQDERTLYEVLGVGGDWARS